jgi:hypothetical protein
MKSKISTIVFVLWIALFVVATPILGVVSSCATLAKVAPALMTVNDLAKAWCESYYGLDMKKVCKSREVLDLFKAQVQALDKTTGVQRPVGQ